MKENQIIRAYEDAREIYASYGVDTDKAFEALDKIRLSVHCWQGDDVTGFEGGDAFQSERGYRLISRQGKER
jgi:L-rhamnose isomerase